MNEQKNVAASVYTGGTAPDPMLDLLYDLYISFVAVGGLQVTEEGEISRLKLQQVIDGFNAQHSTNINRASLWKRRQKDAQFADKVSDRRSEIAPIDRVAAVWRGVFLQAAKGAPLQAEMYLANFDPKYIVPSKKVEISATGLADVLQLMRKRQNVIDAQAANQAQLPAGE